MGVSRESDGHKSELGCARILLSYMKRELSDVLYRTPLEHSRD